MAAVTKTKWAGLVREGKVAAKKESEAKWELGRLALQVPLSKGGGSCEKGDLRTYAEEIGVDYDILVDYRRVAEAWQPGTVVPGCSWSVHRELVNQQHLIHPGMTTTEARAAIGRKVKAKVEATDDEVVETVSSDNLLYYGDNLEGLRDKIATER